MSETLYEKTVRLIAERPASLTLADIARGAEVKPTWLSALVKGDIPEPGVHKIQRLHDFMTNRRPGCEA